MLIATLIVTTIALVRRRFARRTGKDMPTAGPRPGKDIPGAGRRPLRKSGSILRRPAPVLATGAALAVLGAGGGVLLQC